MVRKKKEAMFVYQEEANLVNLSDSKEEDDEEEELMQYMSIQADVVLSLVQKLTPAYRAVFNMYVIDNMPHKEIAETLHISIGSSKSNLAKAKMRLRDLFRNYIHGKK